MHICFFDIDHQFLRHCVPKVITAHESWVSFSFIHSPRLHLCQFLYHFTLLIYLDVTSCILVLFQLSFLNILQSTQFLSKMKYLRKNLSSIMERTLFYPKKIEKKYSKSQQMMKFYQLFCFECIFLLKIQRN